MEEKVQNEQEQTQESKNPPKGVKRTVAGIVIAVVAVLTGFYIHNEMKYQSTDDAYVETTTVNVSPRVSGQIEEVYVTDNQHVKAGDLVAVIDAEDYKIRL